MWSGVNMDEFELTCLERRNQVIAERMLGPNNFFVGINVWKYYVECPNQYDGSELSLFLGGGITGCPDWQKLVVYYFYSKHIHLVMLNPRRQHFNVNNHSIHNEQILWEFNHLRKADAIMFWFPKETLCPITLYELGAWSILSSQTGTKLFVGCHPNYMRRADVETQTKFVRPDIEIVYSLNDIIKQIEAWYNEQQSGNCNDITECN